MLYPMNTASFIDADLSGASARSSTQGTGKHDLQRKVTGDLNIVIAVAGGIHVDSKLGQLVQNETNILSHLIACETA